MYGLVVSLVVTMFPAGAVATDQQDVSPEEMGEISLYNYTVSVTDVTYLDQMSKVTVTDLDTGEIVDPSEYEISYVEQLFTGEYRRVEGTPKHIGTYGVVISDQPGGTYAVESNFDDELSMFVYEEAIFSIGKLLIDGTEDVSVLFDGKNEIEFDGSSMEIPEARVLLAGKELPREEFDILFCDENDNQVTAINHVGQYKAVIVDHDYGDDDNMEILSGVQLVAEFSVVDKEVNPGSEPEIPPVVPPTPTPKPTPMPDPNPWPDVPDVNPGDQDDKDEPDEPVVPDVPEIPEVPDVPEVNPEKPGVNPDDGGEGIQPEKPGVIVPAAPEKIKVTTDYRLIGVEIGQPDKNIYGYRLGICQKGRAWRYVNLKKGKFVIRRLYKQPLVKNGVYTIKVAAMGKDKVVGKYSKPLTVRANLKGNCSVPMERAQLTRATSRNRAVTVTAKLSMKNTKIKTYYRFAWREKNSLKWHYSKVTNSRMHKFVRLKKGKSYVMSLRYCYVSPVDGKTRVWSHYSRKLVKVR